VGREIPAVNEHCYNNGVVREREGGREREGEREEKSERDSYRQRALLEYWRSVCVFAGERAREREGGRKREKERGRERERERLIPSKSTARILASRDRLRVRFGVSTLLICSIT
jgi:hypothetical protein